LIKTINGVEEVLILIFAAVGHEYLFWSAVVRVWIVRLFIREKILCVKKTHAKRKQKRNARGFERAKHKTTSCVPYKSEERVSSTIITFCPVNLDKNNLRKRTGVNLLLGQATLIVGEKGSTKIDFNKFARRLFRGFYRLFVYIVYIFVFFCKRCKRVSDYFNKVFCYFFVNDVNE